MNVNEFDKYIRTSLEDMEVPPNDQHWSLMEQHLDHLSNIDMSDAELDSVVKDGLQNTEVPLNASHWALMEEQLNADSATGNEVPSETVDQMAYQALAGQEVPYDPSTWDRLEERLDAGTNHTNLIRSKTIEAILILLALFTVLHFMHRQDSQPDNNQPTTPASIASVTDENSSSQNKNTTIENTATQAADIITTAEQSTNDETQTFQKNTVVSTQTNVSSANVSANAAGTSENSAANTTTTALKSQNQHATVPPLTPYEQPIASLGTLPLADFDLLTIDQGSALNKRIPIAAVTSQSNLRIGVSAGPILDQVYTPKDASFQNGGEERWASSMAYQFGVSAELTFGRWAFGSGAYYVSRSYTPQNRVIIVGGNSTHGYVADISRNAEFNIVSVPLTANYDIKSGNKWNFYATAGINGNFVMENNFDVQRDYCYNCGGPSNPTGPGGGVNPETLPDLPQSQGILEGGNLKDNMWFSAQAGFGIERKLLDNNILYIQPTYQHFIGQNGIGLHEDRFYSLSVLAGVKVAF